MNDNLIDSLILIFKMIFKQLAIFFLIFLNNVYAFPKKEARGGRGGGGKQGRAKVGVGSGAGGSSRALLSGTATSTALLNGTDTAGGSSRTLLSGTTTSTALSTGQLQIGTTSSADSAIQMLTSTTGTAGVYFGDGTTGDTRYRGAVEYANNGDSLRFYSASTERMRITNGGNVGVGTSSPAYKLQVTGTDGSGLVVATSSDASGVTTYMQANASVSGVFGTLTNHPQTFVTNNTERMRIDSSGNLLVGTTAAISSGFTTISYNGTALNGLIISESANSSGTTFLGFNNGVTNIGNVSRVGATSAVIYNTTSDLRLKSNITAAAPVLDKLMNVKVRQFDWTEGDLHQEAGFIAQELAPVLSGIVTKGKTEEDMWQMDYARLTPYLAKAIQEQQILIENLTTRLNALEGK